MKLIDIIIASEGNLLFKIDFDRAGFTPFVVDTLRDRGLKNHGIYNTKTIWEATLSLGPIVLQNPEVVIKDFIEVQGMYNMTCCCIELVAEDIAQDDESCYHEAVTSNIQIGVTTLVRTLAFDLAMSSKEVENRLFKIKTMLVNLFKKDFYKEYKKTITFVNAYLIYSIKEEKISSKPLDFNRFEQDPIAYIASDLIFKTENGPFMGEINMLDIMPILYHLNRNRYALNIRKTSIPRYVHAFIASSEAIKDAVCDHITGKLHLSQLCSHLSNIQIADIRVYDKYNGLHIYEKNTGEEDHRSYSMIKFNRTILKGDHDDSVEYTNIGSIRIPLVFEHAHKNLLQKCESKGIDQYLSTLYLNDKTTGIVYNEHDSLVYALWIETPIDVIYLYRQIY